MLHTLKEAVILSSRRYAPLLLIFTLFRGGGASADLLAYDPFAYGGDPAQGQYLLGDEGSGINVLGGQNPTIGPMGFYNGPWIQSGGDSQVVKDLPSLAYPGLAAGMGGIQQESVQFDCCSFGRSGREIAGGLGGGGARTIYQSYLIDFGTQGADSPSEFGYRGHELWNGGVGDSTLAVALFLNSFSAVNELSLSVTTASSTMTVPVAGGGLNLDALAGVHLVVMKYEFNPIAPDVVSVFLDPVVGAGEPGVADAEVSVPMSDLFITHQGAYTQFTFSGSTHTPGAIDEIRWGNGFADVTPIPAPATAVLLLIASMGVGRSRRR